jgi:hypothetical protein
LKPSTATFISYNLRPAKQAERRILLDFLKCAGDAGVAISDCRYVGMGGTMFYDFHLMHRFLGITRMVSLERDPDTHPRCLFNRPFEFIAVENESAATFMAKDRDSKPTIYWFDYDDGFGADIVADILSLGARVRPGGFAFATVCESPPGVLAKQNKAQRLEYFQEKLGDFAIGLTADDLDNAAFPGTLHRILVQAFQSAFAVRSDGKFQTLFQIRYRDTSPMITVGGCFGSSGYSSRIRERVRSDLPFLLTGDPYQIRHLNLTPRERDLFDIAATKPRKNSKQANSLRSLGFKKADFDAYRDLLRFLPRYFESII